MIYFVSRHEGAIEWAKRQPEWQIDRFVPHLDTAEIQAGDVVLGTLPLHLAAEVCAKGAEFWFLQIEQAFQSRGAEHTAADMGKMGAKLRRFNVVEVV